jgi:molybdopterin-guanine dinucleotide biosynthesis adapter protein
VRSGEADASAPPMAPKDPSILAIAADQPAADQRLPWFRRDDIAGIADFIIGQGR